MKKMIVGMSILILLIGIVAGSLMNYFGQINQSFEVRGLVFYASNGHPSTNNNIWDLSINEYIYKDNPVSMSANKYFISSPLEINSAFATNYKVYLEIETREVIDGDININLNYVDENFDKQISICSINNLIVNPRDIYVGQCSVNAIDNINPNYRFQMHIKDNLGSEANYNIYIQGNTRIEVSKP